MKKKLVLALFSLTVIAGGYYAFRAFTRPRILFLGFADQLVILADKASEKSQIKVETWSRETVDAADILDLHHANDTVVLGRI